jgi:hypothetical protein
MWAIIAISVAGALIIITIVSFLVCKYKKRDKAL